MNVVILNQKLGITPGNLFNLVRAYLVFYPRQDEEGKTSWGYYKAEPVPKTASIHILNTHGEWAGDIIVTPLTPLRSRVAITFNDWENDPNEQKARVYAAFSGIEFDPKKRQLFLDLGRYILAIVTSEEKANAWLITTRKQLEDSAGSESQNPENPEEDRPWEYISSEPPGDREIVKLFFEGHSDREIAELVHAGLRTISNALTRIRRDYAHLNLIRKGNPHIQPRSKKARQQK